MAAISDPIGSYSGRLVHFWPSYSAVSRRVSLEFGSERACAPPALSALNLGRLLRVVLPVKRDCSADNPNTPGDYSSCALEE